MKEYFELAEKIYEALLAKGVVIGNASIPIISKVLEEHCEVASCQCGICTGTHTAMLQST